MDDPCIDLASELKGQPILVLRRESFDSPRPSKSCQTGAAVPSESSLNHVKSIREQSHQIWVSIHKVSRLLQGKPHGAFGTRNVENSAKACVRKVHRETGLIFAEIESLLDENGLGK